MYVTGKERAIPQALFVPPPQVEEVSPFTESRATVMASPGELLPQLLQCKGPH